jgi:beta-glucanase (GH16 family)
MKKYVLTWHDEFDYTGKLDETKWSYDVGAFLWGNGERQYYTEGDRNAKVGDGVLTIEGRIEPYDQSPYTSARVTTYGKKHFQYGRLEVMAKIPTETGTWPAIWMLPIDRKEKNAPWPLCGEIDIMEHVTHLFDTIHVSLHTALFNHVDRTQRTHFEKIDGITKDFHEFAFDWTPEYIEFFLDGKTFAKFRKDDPGYTQDETGWPFDKPYYLILNEAIGGTWGGHVEESEYPSKFQIAYVRYYDIVEE